MRARAPSCYPCAIAVTVTATVTDGPRICTDASSVGRQSPHNVSSRHVLPPRPPAVSSRRRLLVPSSRRLQPPPTSRRLQPPHPRGASSRRPRRLPSSRRLFAPPAPDALPQSPAAVSCSRLAPSLGAAVSTDGIVPLWQRGHVLRVGPCTDSCTGPLCMREGDRQNARARSPCVCRRGAACAHTHCSLHMCTWLVAIFPDFRFFSKSDFKSGLHVYNIYHTYGPPPTQTHDMCRKLKIVNPKMQIRKRQHWAETPQNQSGSKSIS